MYKTIFFTLMLLYTSLIFAQHIGTDFYANLADLPCMYSNVKSCYLSSYDRTGGNDDGFNRTYSELYEDKNGEHVIFEEKGPGCIYNIWGTGPTKTADWGTMKFYFDAEKTARLEINADDFFSGLTRPFLFPLVNNEYVSSGASSSCVPFSFSQSLKITTEKKPFFYNIYYQLYKDVKIRTWSMDEKYEKMTALFQSCGFDPKQVQPDSVERKMISLAPFNKKQDNLETFLQKTSPGVIHYLKINPLYKPDMYNLNHIYLRITFENQPEPSVNVPIGPFFGSGLGEADVKGLFVGMSSSGAYYCYFPMPYKRNIKIELENTGYESGGRFFVEVGYSNSYPVHTHGCAIGQFGAKYNKAWPIVGEDDYELFNFEGMGAILGQVMTVEPVKPDIKQWWEGDMRIFIDGEKKPRFHGTGHEDEYQGGWSSFWMTNPYSLPLYGLPKSAGLKDIFGQINGSVTMYRFWPGTIPFKESIRISTEHGTENGRAGNYSSVVYYYFMP